MKKDFAPLHPGEVLLEEFIRPLGLSQHRRAIAMRVSPQKINEIVNGKRGITANTALRLSAALGTTAEFWMCKAIMIWKARSTCSATGCKRKLRQSMHR
jgi:addiction module HigA family antidote